MKISMQSPWLSGWGLTTDLNIKNHESHQSLDQFQR